MTSKVVNQAFKSVELLMKSWFKKMKMGRFGS